MEVREIIREIKRICDEHGIKDPVLFGSYATGTYRERSDIDIAIDKQMTAGEWLDFQDEIEGIRTLRRIDVLNLASGNVSSAMREEIARDGKVF